MSRVTMLAVLVELVNLSDPIRTPVSWKRQPY
jgi:hypothetical protein